MEATANPATSPFPAAVKAADSSAKAFWGPARQARRASWRSSSGSEAKIRCGTLLRATTSPFSSIASALTDVVPTSTPIVIGPARLLTNARSVS
jgi:hypothetical protein